MLKHNLWHVFIDKSLFKCACSKKHVFTRENSCPGTDNLQNAVKEIIHPYRNFNIPNLKSYRNFKMQSRQISNHLGSST